MTKLSKYFNGVASKRLSAVEIDSNVSNQHEFQGIRSMVDIFGNERREFKCTYLYFGDYEEQTVKSEVILTWYDSRERKPERSPEFRFYYKGNIIIELAAEGDLLIIAQKPDYTLLLIVVKKGSTVEKQILWLFGIKSEKGSFVSKIIQGDHDRKIGFAEQSILETLGVEQEIEAPANWLDRINERFGMTFPSTRDFSTFARQTLPEISSIENPDLALISWISHEEMLFKTLERHLVEDKIKSGFSSVEEFISFSLSVQNKRKSRMGYALENHLEKVFDDFYLSYSRAQVTENNSKPDFIFPSIEDYHDPEFLTEKITMLGSKSTCKDRWRQVLSEAQRITYKHLLTLEPGISENQTNEMRGQNLQLILPESLHETYSKDQQNWLMNLSEFIDLIRHRQKI